MLEVILKRFEHPDEIRTFEKGRFELVRLGGMTIGRATYEPGWKWSEHVGRAAGAKSCAVEHVGMVVSGRATAAMDDGRVIEMKAGDIFYIAPGHDSWVVGDKPYVSIHLMGADAYANAKKSACRAKNEAHFEDVQGTRRRERIGHCEKITGSSTPLRKKQPRPYLSEPAPVIH